MKRTNLPRRTPPKPGTKGLRRTELKRSQKPLPRVSQAKRKRDREQKKAYLADFRADHPLCMCHPSCRRPAREIHEICAGAYRLLCRSTLAGVLHLHPDCHDAIQGEPWARGLARKRLCDPEHYDRRALLRVLGLPETAVTESAVESEIETLTVAR